MTEVTVPKIAHVMIDLETLGTLPGSVILSIGAVVFDPSKPISECIEGQFYCVVNTEDSLRHGLKLNQATLDWWERQSQEAREVLHEAASQDTSSHLNMALEMLAHFIPQGPRCGATALTSISRCWPWRMTGWVVRFRGSITTADAIAPYSGCTLTRNRWHRQMPAPTTHWQMLSHRPNTWC